MALEQTVIWQRRNRTRVARADLPALYILDPGTGCAIGLGRTRAVRVLARRCPAPAADRRAWYAQRRLLFGHVPSREDAGARNFLLCDRHLERRRARGVLRRRRLP